MNFSLDRYAKFKEIVTWNRGKQYIKDLEGATEWTAEDFAEFNIPEAEVKAFFENIKTCGIPASERNKTDYIPAFIQISANVAVFRDAYFFKNGNMWRCDSKSREKVLYKVFEDISLMSKFLVFLNCDERSQARTFESMTINFIPAGNEFFDISNGCMVSEAPIDELRTYSIPAVEYTPMTLDECTSKLMKDLIKHLGKDNLDYLMRVTADSMRGLHTADRRAMFIIGATRTAKGTFGEVLKRVGLAPMKELTHDFAQGNDFLDGYAEVASMYPVIFIDEAESVNFQKTKKMCSDATIQCNLKGLPAITVINRGVLMFTSNRTPHTKLEGVCEKVTYLTTQGIQFKKDNDYFDKLTHEDYNEFLCVLLTLCHEILETGWDNSQMPPEVERTHMEFINENLPVDAFFMQWDKEADAWISGDDSYRAHLMYANPDVDLNTLENAMAKSREKPKSFPDGLEGMSRQEFMKALKANHIEMKIIKGFKYFKGVPPKHSIEGDTDIVDFA